MTLRLFLVAGEPSGDRLGAALMAGLKTLAEEPGRVSRHRGPMMQAEGLQTLFPMEELSVIGLTEILANYRRLARRVSDTAEAVLAMKPDALITIDIPEFSLRVAAKVNGRRAAPAHCALCPPPPSGPGGRNGRERWRAASTMFLALLPFEPPYMQAEGNGPATFVGHPVVTEPQASEAEIAAFRDKHALGDGPKVLVLPGSRRSEIERLAPVFGEALRPVLARHPDAQVILPAAPAVAALVAEKTRGWPGADDHSRPARAKRGRLRRRKAGRLRPWRTWRLRPQARSAWNLRPARRRMVIAYDMSWLSRKMVSAMLRVDTVTLVNLVSDSRAVPEFLGEACRPAQVAAALNRLLDDEGARLEQLDAMALTMQRLGRGGEAPGLRAARSVLSVI